MSLPSLAEVEHADWPALKRMCAGLGLNPKGRSAVVRIRLLDHVRRRVRPEVWHPGVAQQAALLTRLGFSDPAVRLWESVIRLDEPGPWIGMGRAELAAGDLSEAAKAFERAVQMGDAVAILHRAESLAAAGNYEGAIRMCEAYLAARPRDLRGMLLKANFVARGGWTEQAATLMRDAFELHPDLRELWRGLGAMLLKGRRYDVAAEAYQEALRASPNDADAWVNHGVALLLAGRAREATGAFREALELDPDRAAALNDLGVAYLREGHLKSAAVNLERAAKHLETPQTLLNVAKVQEAAHERAAALESYARVLRLKPRDAEAVAARKRLAPPKAPRRKTEGRAVPRARARTPAVRSAKRGEATKRSSHKKRARPVRKGTRTRLKPRRKGSRGR